MSFMSRGSDQTVDSKAGMGELQRHKSKSNIKCVVVGDAMVGKTSLARRLACLGYQTDYDPTTFDNYAVTTSVDGKSYVISLFDTAGQNSTLDACYGFKSAVHSTCTRYEEFGHLRTLSYVNCEVFLLCFSVASPQSFEHAQTKWISEIRKHSPHSSIILVGTQIDLRDDATLSKIGPMFHTSKNSPCLPAKIRPSVYSSGKGVDVLQAFLDPKGNCVFVSTKEGLNASSGMDVDSYVECSSLTEAGIRRLTEEIVESGLRYVEEDDSKGCRCACTVM